MNTFLLFRLNSTLNESLDNSSTLSKTPENKVYHAKPVSLH